MSGSLRWRIATVMAVVALVATAAVGAIGYRSTSARLIDEVDRSISEAVGLLSRRESGPVQVPTRNLLNVYAVRVLTDSGAVVQSSFRDGFPVGDAAAAVVGSERRRVVENVTVDDVRFRVHTIGLPKGAVQVGRPLTETDSVLRDLRARTFVLVTLVSLLAAALGWLLAGSVVAPLRRLTRAAETVEASGAFDVEVPAAGSDEVGRLGIAFRSMLGALQRSRTEQQRLVQDAGHELRTPLTSLRTNLAVLRRHPTMDDEMKAQVLDDLDGEVSELSDLVNELIAAASGQLADQPSEQFDLGAVADVVAMRVARRRARPVTVEHRSAAIVEAPRAAIERAVSNLVDNAAKFDGTAGEISVVVDGGTLTVLDRGPGIAEADLELVWDRFHRADAARTMPGSGLGLAIVREVVERQGGTVQAAPRPGGGAAVGFTLPTINP